MHGQDPSMLRGSSRPYGSSGGFDFGNIIGEPIALATISIGFIAWLIAFVSQVLADMDVNIRDYPKFAWWTITYELVCIMSVTIVVCLDMVHKYHVAIVGSLAAGLVFTCSAANNFIYSDKATMEAAGAGHILLSIIHIIWIFYFGSVTPDLSHSYHDSFALHKDSKTSGHLSPYHAGASRPHTSTSSSHPPQMYTSAQLNGFETSSPVSGQYRASSAAAAASAAPADAEPSPPTEYNHRAKAIYAYDANPEDVNEISFAKNEILDVSDVSGRWWQARKQNGETGIAPSNYLILL